MPLPRSVLTQPPSLPALLSSQNLPDSILGIMQNYLKYGATFRVEGSEF